MATLSLDEAHRLVASALEANGAAPEVAASVARALVGAEADGLKGHGLSRTPTYVGQLRSGKAKGDAVPSASRPRPAAIVIDAAEGFAYPAIDLALGLLPEAARALGIAAASIHRSHHCGAAGRPVEALAEQGLVAMLFANTPAAMAPWGGAQPVFGTNPIAFACPLPGREPIVVDLSLSKVARGNILAAKQRGESIPEGWALDKDGKSTTDPVAALAGTMAPLGDAKGVALALMVELLAAGLTGARYAGEASSFLDEVGDPPGTGQLILALDPSAFSANGPARFAALAAAIEGQDGARLPGARRIAARRKAEEAGLTIADALVAEIKGLAT